MFRHSLVSLRLLPHTSHYGTTFIWLIHWHDTRLYAEISLTTHKFHSHIIQLNTQLNNNMICYVFQKQQSQLLIRDFQSILSKFHNIVEFKLLESSVYCYPLRASRFGICLRPNSMGTSLSKTIAKLFETMLDLCTMKIASSRYCLPPPNWFEGGEESVRVCNYFLTAIFRVSFTLDDSQLSIARWKMSKIENNPIRLSYGPKSGSTLGICENIAFTCGGFF